MALSIAVCALLLETFHGKMPGLTALITLHCIFSAMVITSFIGSGHVIALIWLCHIFVVRLRSRSIKAKKFKVYLETTFFHLLCNSVYFEPKMFFFGFSSSHLVKNFRCNNYVNAVKHNFLGFESKLDENMHFKILEILVSLVLVSLVLVSLVLVSLVLLSLVLVSLVLVSLVLVSLVLYPWYWYPWYWYSWYWYPLYWYPWYWYPWYWYPWRWYPWCWYPLY